MNKIKGQIKSILERTKGFVESEEFPGGQQQAQTNNLKLFHGVRSRYAFATGIDFIE